MRFGLLLSAQFPDQPHSAVLDATVATAVAAEETGFDDAWVAEHHIHVPTGCSDTFARSTPGRATAHRPE
ncbi:LLM class flavin-dependent oxidoreductase [Pseudonocardia humida]|uniref:LLM class flavin-dependent oxidoreductase n=1 Tax=Pseudonocardia humida TaxID=2800819 RepID=A0ABT1AD41_9PSEU|nr:LLM class flavin-dependent oxidoreductase [Pseudonocardia humida]MCO1660987.1 LLM class flavin-dependent oxidoreductase [Pseudonocardia humida]